MFEKEAEEYALENYENCLYDDFPYVNDSRAREQSFKDGAEFGYNKAKNDSDKMKSRFLELCNLKDMRIKEKEEHLSKAKEIIERLVEGIRIISDPKIYMTDVDTFVSEAEQFLEEN